MLGSWSGVAAIGGWQSDDDAGVPVTELSLSALSFGCVLAVWCWRRSTVSVKSRSSRSIFRYKCTTKLLLSYPWIDFAAKWSLLPGMLTYRPIKAFHRSLSANPSKVMIFRTNWAMQKPWWSYHTSMYVLYLMCSQKQCLCLCVCYWEMRKYVCCANYLAPNNYYAYPALPS